MIKKVDLLFLIDDLRDEINALRIRVEMLEKRNLKKSLKKIADKPKRGRGRPRKTDK